jgi:hypothetical protein
MMPTEIPTFIPTVIPTTYNPTIDPTSYNPTTAPTIEPTTFPTFAPSSSPSMNPTTAPTVLHSYVSNIQVTTFAGSSTSGSADGTGAAAQFDQPYIICMDRVRNIIYVPQRAAGLRKVDASTAVTASIGSNYGFAGLQGCVVNEVTGDIYTSSFKTLGMISYGDQSTGILLAGSTSTCKFIMFL